MSDMHSETVGYVSRSMIPQSAPPSTAVGPTAWVRTNLLATPRDTFLTLASIAFVVFLAYTFVPWFANGVWDAGSVAECREILDGRHGACFAVIIARFEQLMFGFYPPGELWRPILALALFIPAVAPILGEGRVRSFWPLSVLYPIATYYLLFGGSIWGIAATLVGPFVGYVVFRGVRQLTSGPAAALAGVLATLVFWRYGTGPLTEALNGTLGTVGLARVETTDFGGALLAMIIGVSGIVLSFPLGILLALGRQSDLPIVKMLCVGFIEFIRGVPLITLLFVASTLLNYFLPVGVSFDLLLRVIILVTLFAAAYMAEVIRGGLAAIPRGQYEAAQAMGLPYWDSMRLIILPQALKVAVPGIVSTFIGLFKDTTLVSIIGLFDVLGIRNSIENSPQWKGVFWELILFATVFFFICCFAMSRYSMYLERRLDTGHR